MAIGESLSYRDAATQYCAGPRRNTAPDRCKLQRAAVRRAPLLHTQERARPPRNKTTARAGRHGDRPTGRPKQTRAGRHGDRPDGRPRPEGEGTRAAGTDGRPPAAPKHNGGIKMDQTTYQITQREGGRRRRRLRAGGFSILQAKHHEPT